MTSWRKLICGLLFGAILFSICNVPVFGAENEATETYGTRGLGLIRALQIADYKEGSLSEPITRSEFHKLAALAGGYPEQPLTNGRFSDLDAENECAGYTEVLAIEGIISPDPLGRIYPDGSVTVREAMTIAVKILGYSLRAEDLGGYPSGYVRTAHTLNLYSDVNLPDDTLITKGMAVQILYNALDTDVMNRTYGGSGFRLETGCKLMEDVFGVSHKEGIVNGVDITRLMGENDVEPFHIEINGEAYESRDIKDVYSYLGYNVDVYYKYVDRENRAVYIQKNEKNREVVIPIKNIISVDGGKVKYTSDESGKTKSISCTVGAPLIYNGVTTKQVFDKSLTDGKLGAVKLLSNDGSASPDVIFVEAYTNYIAAGTDEANSILYDMYDLSKKIVLDTTEDDPYTIIYDGDGSECGIENIKKDDIVSVFNSPADAYQKYIRAYISNHTETGQISYTEKDSESIVLGENEYDITKDCVEYNTDLIKAGAYVTAYFDFKGIIARLLPAVREESDFAFIAGAETVGVFDNEIELRLYTSNSEFKVFPLASRTMIDGIRYKNNDTAILEHLHKASAAQFGDSVPGKARSSVVKYRMNEAGAIFEIDTVLNGKTQKPATRDSEQGAGDVLFMVNSSSATDYYRQGYNTIGTVFSFASDTPIMLTPAPQDNDMNNQNKYFNSLAVKVFVHDGKYSASAFYTDRSRTSAEFISMAYSEDIYSSINESSHFAVVDEILSGLNNNGEEADIISVLSGGMNRNLIVSDGLTFAGTENEKDPSLKARMTAKDLKRGDIIYFNTNINGYVSYIEMVFRAAGKIPLTNYSATYRVGRGFRHGFVYDVLGDGCLVYYTNSSDRSVMQNVTAADCELLLYGKTNTDYYSYGISAVGKEFLENSSSKAIKGYKTTGADCSELVMQINYGIPMAILSLE